MAANIGAELAALKRRLDRLERGSRLAAASIENTAVQVFDAGGSLRAIVGQQGDGTTAVNVVNGPMPPTPTAPTVEPALAALSVTWDGLFADAQAAPLDWMRVEVHIGPDADYTPDQGTLRDTIETPQGGSVVVPLPYTEWFIKLRSRTTSGVAGPATAAVAGTPRKAEAADITAGAITADHIAVDALTGKTITGGTVTGAVVQTASSGERITLNEAASNAIRVYDSTGRLVGVLDGAGVQLIGDNGSAIILDPDATYPNLRLTSDDGTQEAVINVSGASASEANLGLNSGKFAGSGFTDMKWRTFFGNDFWVAERVRTSSLGTHIGGRIFMNDGQTEIGYSNTADPSTNSTLTFFSNLVAQLTGARLQLNPAASSNSALYLQAAAGQTGLLLHLRNSTSDVFKVDANGILTTPSIITGNVNITPSAANTPSGVTVTGLNLPGTVHRAFVTAQSGVPGTVTEVTANNVTSDGLTIWLSRTNTTTTSVWYLIISS